MNPNRMTIEELKELKPSLSNPVELVCDDSHYYGIYKKITVIGFNLSPHCINIIDNRGKAVAYSSPNLIHYPSFKKPKTPKETVEMIAIKAEKEVGAYHFFTKRMIEFIAKELQSETPESKELLNALMNLKVD